MDSKKIQILLTNDDGIESPGLWAAAEALSEIGYVWVTAPRDQASSTGRSMPHSSDGLITEQQMVVNGTEWTVYAVGGTPAQTVQHAVIEIIGKKPDLVVSGINYGLNLGTGITISGTVGAAMEAASFGVPALAVSLETAKEHHLTYSTEIDFSCAARFTKVFAQKMLTGQFDPRVQVLKIEVPKGAGANTQWMLTRLALERYYYPVAPTRESWDIPGSVGYNMVDDLSGFTPGSDTYTVLVDKKVAVTPISLDMTANVAFKELEDQLRQGE
ncbi:MAG: 5'/3'-nucleotidase SurE [Chloroflexota bacterium]